MNLQDNGVRREFDTGSRRDIRKGKGRWDLIPFEFLMELARHFEEGSVKYGDRNWEKGQPCSVYLDSAMRHLAQVPHCNKEPHAIAAAWNIAALIATVIRIRDGALPAHLMDIPIPCTHHADAEAQQLLAEVTELAHDLEDTPIHCNGTGTNGHVVGCNGDRGGSRADDY